MINYTLRRGLIGKRLREARENAGLTQDELVDKLGKKTSTAISEYEKGKRSFAADELVDFSEALNVPALYFLQDLIVAQDDMEAMVINWFRSLPDDNARRLFLARVEHIPPLILGEPTTYKPKRKGK